MLQDKKKIDKYIKEHLDGSNRELYEFCLAETKEDKAYLRTRLSRLRKKIDTGKDAKLNIEALTPSTVEKLIIDKLNKNSKVPDLLIRMALDYCTKLKAKDEEGMEQLDMEQFLK